MLAVVLIGLITGIISGMALGGGIILIPALVFLKGLDQHLAQGVTLFSYLPVSLVAAYTHYRQGNVRPKLGLLLIIGSLIGAAAGAYFSAMLTSDTLRRIFGIFLLIMGIYELCCKEKVHKKCS